MSHIDSIIIIIHVQLLFQLVVLFRFKKFQHFDFDVSSALSTVSVGMTNLLVYCYFGKMTTDSYRKMSDCVFEMNWPELPNQLQKFIILMIENMQRPLYYHGFGIVNLDLETFAKVSVQIPFEI